MRPLIRANQASAAVNNRRLAVQMLRQCGPLSRRQLAEQSGLQNSTVTYIVRDLMERGMVRSVGKRGSTGVGKKQVLLELNPELGWVVGVGIESDSVSLVYLDAAGSVLDRDRISMREPVQMLPRILRTRVDNWVDRHRRPSGKLLGVGVGVPGIVDHQRGVVLRSTRYRMQNWPLAELVREVFGALTCVDNDSNFAALAEARQGSGADMDSFLYFLMNSREEGQDYAIRSLGSSLFLEGNLYRGAHFSSGEIDTLIDAEPYGRVTAEQLLLLNDREGELADSLKPIGDRMVRTLAALVDVIDPTAVILGGNVGVSNQKMIAYVEEQLNQRIVQVPERRVQVRPSMFMDHGVSMGAGIAVLDAALQANDDETFDAEPFPVLEDARPYAT